MPTATVGVFTIDYALYTNAAPGFDIKFGMDFTLTNTPKKPLSQLIFPATLVGHNQPGQWNIDNHREGNDPLSLVFANAENGTIVDPPREIQPAGTGVKITLFAVYIVDIPNATVQSSGVQFGYTIDTNAAHPETAFIRFAVSNLAQAQKDVLRAKCPYIKFT